MTYQVTERFVAANRALGPISAFNGADCSVQLVQDCQSRATECESLRAGQQLAPHQVEFMQCLRSRLQDYGMRDCAPVQEWLAAFAEGFEAKPPSFEVVLYNSSRCELDRKQGEDLPALLRELADEGCLSGGDEIHIIDYADDAA